MKKYIICTLLIFNSYISADEILSPNGRSLSQREQHSISLSNEWLNNGNKSFRGQDGSVSFLYGATMPRVIVAPLKITDIQFQVGEEIKDVQLGDTTRWIVTPSISGEGEHQISHLLIKTTDVGLETTLFISTNRRTYHMNLYSRRYEYMPIVGFKYREESNKQWESYRQNFKEQKQRSPKRNFLLNQGSNLDFEYNIIGETSWKPTRVYNDGIKTYIQMPKKMKFQEAPIFMVLDQNSNNQLVNYRLKENSYIVDKLFQKGILIMGVGTNQEKITIEKKGYTTSNTLWEDEDDDY